MTIYVIYKCPSCKKEKKFIKETMPIGGRLMCADCMHSLRFDREEEQ